MTNSTQRARVNMRIRAQHITITLLLLFILLLVVFFFMYALVYYIKIPPLLFCKAKYSVVRCFDAYKLQNKTKNHTRNCFVHTRISLGFLSSSFFLACTDKEIFYVLILLLLFLLVLSAKQYLNFVRSGGNRSISSDFIINKILYLPWLKCFLQTTKNCSFLSPYDAAITTLHSSVWGFIYK